MRSTDWDEKTREANRKQVCVRSTRPRVKESCRRVTQRKMAETFETGVALGRATEKKGLRVIGFKRSSVLKHEDSLYQFYDTSTNNGFDNSWYLTCCNIKFNNTEGNYVDPYENSDLDVKLSGFSDGEIEEIDFLLSRDHDITDEPCEPDQELFVDLKEIAALFSDLNATPIDKVVNEHYKNKFENVASRLKTFVYNLYLNISAIFYETCGNVSETSVESKVWTKYYTEVYQYSISSEYAGLAKSLFQNEPSSLDFQQCSKIFDKVTSAVLKKQADTITSQEKCISSDSGKGKLRKNNTENQGEKDTICPLCQRIYVDGDGWIACDICDVWYDRQCLDLSDSQWSDIEGDDWYCPK
ncbi:unnamed protein product [Mytilus edulis]|uniref:PHD-type domain-containing protein n=1 Tax=Mytilus edulis TaxID=6550 RepID=A0A8S3US88_MYTED|nr:unnamed protein product [Mytilus edulis]